MDGLRLTAENVDRRLRDRHAGDAVTITVFRDHNLMRHQVTLESAPEDTCYLLLDDEANSIVVDERNRWLNQS